MRWTNCAATPTSAAPACEVDDNEGNEPLFHTNQLLVATSFDETRVGSVGAAFRHYAAWKTVVGVADIGTEADVAASLGKSQLSEQERLVAGLLAPANLLDVVRHFTLFMAADGQMVKSVCRYQQYRAVMRAIERLRTGKTRRQDGEHDRRGGIIWHTQGSGKSLTMVFLIRKLRTDPQLRRFKVVMVTDRTDLEVQLSGHGRVDGRDGRRGHFYPRPSHAAAAQGAGRGIRHDPEAARR